MNKPFIFCHMITSIDGKIDGRHKEFQERSANVLDYYELAFGEKAYYHPDGWLSGRATSEAGFTKGKQPELDLGAPVVSEGDFIADQPVSTYYISIDSSGKLGWETNSITYRQTPAHIVEVLTEKASNAYKHFLREKNISYLIVGQDQIDFRLLFTKLKQEFGIETLMLGGGGVLNWSLIQQGLVDEVSILGHAPLLKAGSKALIMFLRQINSLTML